MNGIKAVRTLTADADIEDQTTRAWKAEQAKAKAATKTAAKAANEAIAKAAPARNGTARAPEAAAAPDRPATRARRAR